MVSVHQLFCKCDPRLVNFSSALDGASCAQANLLKSWKVVPGTWSQIMKSSLNILQCLRMSLLQVYILDKSSHTSSKFRVSEHSPLSDCSDAALQLLTLEASKLHWSIFDWLCLVQRLKQLRPMLNFECSTTRRVQGVV